MQDTTLRTDHLNLRPFRAADAAAVAGCCGDARVARMAARLPHPHPPERAAS